MHNEGFYAKVNRDPSNTLAMPEGTTRVSREEVKVLAKSIGVRESARQLGIPESTVQSWSQRYQWFKAPELPKSVANKQGATIATKSSSEAYESHLRSSKAKSKSLLARFVVNASKVAARSRSPLSDATKVKDVAAVYDKVWPGEKESTGTQLNVLNIGGSMTINDKGLG